MADPPPTVPLRGKYLPQHHIFQTATQPKFRQHGFDSPQSARSTTQICTSAPLSHTNLRTFPNMASTSPHPAAISSYARPSVTSYPQPTADTSSMPPLIPPRYTPSHSRSTHLNSFQSKSHTHPGGYRAHARHSARVSTSPSTARPPQPLSRILTTQP